eukprot:scaffold34695_cov266-Amphora_coffeaeformis.AAC.1
MRFIGNMIGGKGLSNGLSIIVATTKGFIDGVFELVHFLVSVKQTIFRRHIVAVLVEDTEHLV